MLLQVGMWLRIMKDQVLPLLQYANYMHVQYMYFTLLHGRLCMQPSSIQEVTILNSYPEDTAGIVCTTCMYMYIAGRVIT